MIQLLLLILKIAGILLLAAAGLALTAILLVLFVPVRYRAEGSRYGAWCARGRVSWLFGALQLEASFENGEAEAALKILGRTVRRERGRGRSGGRSKGSGDRRAGTPRHQGGADVQAPQKAAGEDRRENKNAGAAGTYGVSAAGGGEAGKGWRDA